MRTRLPALSALALTALFAAAGPAIAWERHTTVVTPRGTATADAYRDCANWSCDYSRSATLPNGLSSETQRSITRIEPGVAEFSTSRTGFNGRTVERNGTITRNWD